MEDPGFFLVPVSRFELPPVTSLKRVPLPLGYTGIGASEWIRTTTVSVLNAVSLPLEYARVLVLLRGVEPRPVRLRVCYAARNT